MRRYLLAATAVFMFGYAQSAFAEPQPFMQAALRSLEDAKASLQRASHDKGGHRVKAIALINEAIDQVKKGIDYDNKR